MNTLFQRPLPGGAETRRFRAPQIHDQRSAPSREPECIHQFFEQQVEQTPEAIALVFGEHQFTYAHLNAAASQWAGRLRDLRVGPEVRVGVCLPRCPEMVIALLAILKAGGAYVPMDPAYPADRIALMIEDAQAPVIITRGDLRSVIPAGSATVLCIDELEAGHRVETSETHSPVTGEHLAYVIYTSGSTGRPKGVMVRHRNVANFFRGMDSVLGSENGVWLAVTSISFDISVLELFWTLSRGFKVILHGELRSGGASIADQLIRWNVTHFQCTPSQAAMLAEDARTLTALRRLKCLLLGGEALPLALAKRLEGAGELLNMYGPTETTVWSTVHRWKAAAGSAAHGASDGVSAATVPIGHPILNTEVFILDAERRPVPEGEPGELYIGGAGVVRGYLNRPDLTEQRFVSNPFSESGGERLYRTGDVVRCLPGGTLEFLGRADHQIKLRGHRIELGEIEAVLGSHHAVREAVVSVWEPAPGDRRLAAYYVARQGMRVGRGELRGLCRERLPEHMVPAAYVELQALPLTPNGKTDRGALPKPGPEAVESDAVFVAAASGMERTIAAIWSELLKVERVGLNDNFFDLGGHSVLLAQAQMKLREALEREVPLLDLFQFPTVKSLAAYLDGGRQQGSDFDRIRFRAARQRVLFGLEDSRTGPAIRQIGGMP